jgi:hypothetical protein
VRAAQLELVTEAVAIGVLAARVRMRVPALVAVAEAVTVGVAGSRVGEGRKEQRGGREEQDRRDFARACGH